MSVDLSGKRLGLLKEVVPNLSRVALLVDPTDPSTGRSNKAHEAAAQTLGLSLWPVEIKTSGEVEPAFAKIVQDRAVRRTRNRIGAVSGVVERSGLSVHSDFFAEALADAKASVISLSADFWTSVRLSRPARRSPAAGVASRLQTALTKSRSSHAL
jgi:hypothetical protein